jgi:hypothetical protein
MSRILFAAARGARIECWLLPQKKWIPAIAVRVADGLHIDYRIHPDDAHLQYGPISTALRDCDGEFQWLYINSEHMHDFVIRCAIVANYANNMMHEWQQNKDRLTRSLFLLILAEALADEGM